MPGGQTARDLPPREQKRQKIIRAAIDVFAEKGFFGSRMTDVAHAAQVADGTLYLYFEGKEDLLISLFDHLLGRFIERLEDEMAGLEDPLDKLRLMVRLHLETLGRDRALAHVLQIEIRHSRRFLGEIMRGQLGTYLGFLRKIIEEGQQLGRFRRDISPGLATNVVFGAVDELVMSWLLADEPGDLLRHLKPLLRLLAEGLTPCHNHGENG